jgi:hypothetical protein
LPNLTTPLVDLAIFLDNPLDVKYAVAQYSTVENMEKVKKGK